MTALVDHWLHTAVDETWKLLAECQGEDPALWFPRGQEPKLDGQEIRATEKAARAICRQCPVQRECLDYAIDTDTRYGMFGGLNPWERVRITRRRP